MVKPTLVHGLNWKMMQVKQLNFVSWVTKKFMVIMIIFPCNLLWPKHAWENQWMMKFRCSPLKGRKPGISIKLPIPKQIKCTIERSIFLANCTDSQRLIQPLITWFQQLITVTCLHVHTWQSPNHFEHLSTNSTVLNEGSKWVI